MAGQIHYEGQEYYGNVALKASSNFVSTLYLGLYTNVSQPGKDQNMTAIQEVTGGSYARISLLNTDWLMDSSKTVDGGSLFYQPRKTFTFNAPVGNVTGYFVTTTATGTTGKLISTEHFSIPANVNQADFEIRITAKNEFR